MYLALGDTARTLEWLDRGLPAQAANMAQINRAWRFKPLHNNPGFAAILRKAGCSCGHDREQGRILPGLSSLHGPAASFSNRGFPRSGAKFGSIRSHPGVRS